MTLATHQPVGVKNPAMARAKEAALLEVLRGSPEGLRAPALAVSTGSSTAAVVDRLRRLMLRGEAERVGWLWRIPRDDDGDDEPAKLALPEPEPEDPSRWVKPIGRFVRRDTSEFACRRFG
jgi:hypothetical protein